jgi:hypothetical protein
MKVRYERPGEDMAKAILERPVGSVAVAAFTVTVVDGSGDEVYGEPVTARFDLGGGREHSVTRRTGIDGAAHFVEELTSAAHSLTLSAGRESLRPIHLHPGARLVIET